MNESLVILDIDDVLIKSIYSYIGVLSTKYRKKLEVYCDNCTKNSNETIIIQNDINNLNTLEIIKPKPKKNLLFQNFLIFKELK